MSLTDALPIPEELQPLLQRHSGVDWPSIAWDAVRSRASELDRVEALAGQSRLTASQARALGQELRGR